MLCAWIETAARELARVHLGLTDQGLLVAFSRVGGELRDMAVRKIRVMPFVPIRETSLGLCARR